MVMRSVIFSYVVLLHKSEYICSSYGTTFIVTFGVHLTLIVALKFDVRLQEQTCYYNCVTLGN